MPTAPLASAATAIAFVGFLCMMSAVCHCVLCPQVFARASKYSLFDPAKEMVYIEMDADEKKQGKAAVDLVGSQVRAGAVGFWARGQVFRSWSGFLK